MSDLSLYWTPCEFTIDGDSWPGLPLIVDSETMRIEYVPTEFLIYQAAVVGKARSAHTRYAQAHIVLPFLDSLADKNVDWRRMTEEQLTHYRNALEKRKLGRPRIRRVMAFICRFLEWAHQRGHIQTLPFSSRTVMSERQRLSARGGEKTLTSRPVLLPTVPTDRRLPRFFTPDEQKQILEVLDERDRLIVEWANVFIV